MRCNGPGSGQIQAGLERGRPRPRAGESKGRGLRLEGAGLQGRPMIGSGPHRLGLHGLQRASESHRLRRASTRQGGAWPQAGRTDGTLTGDLEEAGGRAHVVRDAALIAAAAVAGHGVQAQLGVVGGLGGGGDIGRRRQQLPLEAPHGRGDALGVAAQERAAQEHRPAQRLAHVLGRGFHLGRDWEQGGGQRGHRRTDPRSRLPATPSDQASQTRPQVGSLPLCTEGQFKFSTLSPELPGLGSNPSPASIYLGDLTSVCLGGTSQNLIMVLRRVK